MAVAQVTPEYASVFSPDDFTSQSALSWAPDAGSDLVFDTDAGTVTGYGAVGEVGVTAGGVEAMVFNFASIEMTSATGSNVVSVTGSRALVLLSPGDITIGVPLDLSGGNAVGNTTGTLAAAGGTGAPGGFDGGTGGIDGDTVTIGEGPGGGRKNSVNVARGGGGAGYGGEGGYGCDYREVWEGTPTAGGAGGPEYGDAQVAALYGGSGGGGGCAQDEGAAYSGGGGGGGAIVIACDGLLTITAAIDCSGGDGGTTDLGVARDASGGGGSGGAIVLSGGSVVLSSTLDVSGGNGGATADVSSENPKAGGGGAGGRIAVFYDAVLSDSSATYDVAGGLKGTGKAVTYPAEDGEEGTTFKKGPEAIAAPVGSLFDPADFNEAAALSWANDSGADLVFNTDTGEVTGYGVVGQPGASASGDVEVMVFNFASIDLTDNSGTDSVVITGSRGAALISAGNINVEVVIDISGDQAPASDGSVSPSPGAVGAVGGYDGGQGSDGAGSEVKAGDGPGAGGANTIQVARGGGGAGYGGAGGTGDDYLGGTWNSSYGGKGGPVYGDALLSDLYGGSGGGGGRCVDAGAGFSGGGAGGGARALIAGGDLTVAGTLDASGGQGGDSLEDAQRDASGGGGSGGALLLKGTTVTLTGTLDVSGGAGGTVTDSDNKHGGGGGGGRIAVYYETALTDGAATYDVAGGPQGTNGDSEAQDGFDGTQSSYRFPVVKAELGSVFDPAEVPSLGALSWANDSGADLVFDTDAGTVTGAGITGTAATGFSASGATEYAVFCFDSITLTDNSGGDSVVVQGSKPLVLLSQGDAQIDVPVSVSGPAGATGSDPTSAGGTAMAGGYDGGLGGDSTGNATVGSGPGAGTIGITAGRGGGGASHAGTGGYGCDAYGGSLAGLSGAVYGERYLLELTGGSGGGGGVSTVEHSGGGAGGGALSIQAVGELTVNAAITADGGAGGTIASTDTTSASGGGGSGGSILLQGTTVTLAATISATGGDGGPNTPAKTGGAGGGGRIVVLYDAELDDATATLDASGGGVAITGSTNYDAYSGTDGTVVASKAPTAQAANKMFFSPWDFTSNGDLAWANDSGSDLVIDTEAGTIDGVEMGQVGISESGESAAMVFCFDNIALLDNSGSNNVVLQGDLPLVLLSRGDIVSSVTLDASGGDAAGGTTSYPALGGTARLGGSSGGRGDNSTSAADNATAGSGPGHGLPPLNNTRGGGGAGHVGAGGIGGDVTGNPTSQGGIGGIAYGDALMPNLYGGSGGAGGRASGAAFSGGGAGGGCIALIAADTLSVGGSILCEGGDGGALTGSEAQKSATGGGGSGGSILLRGQTVNANGVFSVVGGQGGNGASVFKAKGGGGGSAGRIAVYCDTLYTTGSTFNVSGGPATAGCGNSGAPGAAGADGSLQQFTGIPFDGWTVGAIALSDSDPTMNIDPITQTNELAVQVDLGTLTGNGRDVTHILVSTDGFQTLASVPYTAAIAADGRFNYTLPAMADGVATLTLGLVTDLGGLSNVVEDAITLDTTAPTVSTLVPAAGQANPTESLPVNFTATFDEVVQLFESSVTWTTGSGYPNVLEDALTDVSGDVWTITAISAGGVGTIEPGIGSGTYYDEAGNVNTDSATGLPVVYSAPDAKVEVWELY